MRTVRRLIYRSVASSATLVALAFAALAFFIDFVEESQDLGKNGYTVLDALWTCLLMQVRRMVNSEVCAMRDSARMPPISSAIGIRS